MIDYLVATSCRHWDRSVRDLSAQALYKLAGIDPKYMIDCVIEKLIPEINHSDLEIRHGSLMAIGEIARALQKDSLESKSHLVGSVGELLLDYPIEFLESFGSDLNRFAICRHIECLALACWPVSSQMVSIWMNMLETSLAKKDESLQNQSSLAIGALSVSYGIDQKVLERFLKIASSSDHQLGRRGYSLVIGELSPTIMESYHSQILETLSVASKITVFLLNYLSYKNTQSLNDVETRRNALQSLTKFLTKANNYPKSVYTSGLEIYLDSFEDYSNDARGDIGSWIREAGMKGIEQFLFCRSDTGNSLDFLSETEKEDFSSKLISKLCRQSVERIDRVREVAGRLLHRIIWHHTTFPVKRISDLQYIIPE